MSVCSRPLPEDDSIEADVLAVTGPESQPGKNLTLSFSEMIDFNCAIFLKTHFFVKIKNILSFCSVIGCQRIS